ncbi:MAG: hypothetical protein HY235_15160 [Acidobacteria bacterium]|nr:hypothetical protein [Acidobacteriota bacterium]
MTLSGNLSAERPNGARIPQAELEAHLERLLASRTFSRSERLKDFLRFAVEKSLAGQVDRLKESVIGVEVFRREAGFDSAADAIVRVEAKRLRHKLEQYYRTEGARERYKLSIPRGRYQVRIERTRRGWPKRLVWLAGAAALAAAAVAGFRVW